MLYCPKCDYKVIRQDFLDKHLLTHVVQYPEEEKHVEVPVNPPAGGSGTPPVEAGPVEVFLPRVPVQVPFDDEIVLKFTKSVEVYINGKAYVGKEVKLKDMATAAEIVRIARDAYGPNILA